jgi:hypothetical protein
MPFLSVGGILFEEWYIGCFEYEGHIISIWVTPDNRIIKQTF